MACGIAIAAQSEQRRSEGRMFMGIAQLAVVAIVCELRDPE
jgi:hypothetical protein